MLNTTKNLNSTLFEIEKEYFETNNNFSKSHNTDRWTLYTDIINQIIVSGNTSYIYELYYRITSGENINSVLMELIDRDNELYLILYPYNYLLEDYRNFDTVKIFF